MEHRSSRAALNCDDFPPARICIGRDGGLWYRAELQSRSVVRAEPGETTLSLSLSLSVSLSLLGPLCARNSVWLRTEDEDEDEDEESEEARGIYATLVDARLQHSQRVPTERNGKEPRGEEKAPSERDAAGRERETGKARQRDRARERYEEEDAKRSCRAVRLVNASPRESGYHARQPFSKTKPDSHLDLSRKLPAVPRSVVRLRRVE